MFLYQMPRYLALDLLGLKKPNSKTCPDETKVCPSRSVWLADRVSAACASGDAKKKQKARNRAKIMALLTARGGGRCVELLPCEGGAHIEVFSGAGRGERDRGHAATTSFQLRTPKLGAVKGGGERAGAQMKFIKLVENR